MSLTNNNTKILPLAFALILTLIVVFPVLFGFYHSSPSKVFSGIVGLYPMDQFYYLSVGPSQAVKGAVLFADRYGRMSGDHVLLNPIANVIGGIAILFHIPVPIAFLVFRILSAILLALSFLYLVKLFTDSLYTQYVALFIYCFTAGFDFYFHLFRIGMVDAVDDSMPEANMFVSMIGEYYLPLANALFILVMAFYYRISYRNEKKIWLCGISLFLLGAVYIYGLVSAVIIITVIGVYRGIIEKRILSAVAALAKLALFCLPIVAYYGWLMMHFPAMADEGWYRFPSLPALLSTFGFAFLFAFVGFLVKDRQTTKHESYLIIWIVLNLVLLYLPQQFLPIQIQLLIGLGAPLAILFATSLNSISARITKSISVRQSIIYKTGLVSIIILLCSMTNVKFCAKQISELRHQAFPYYIDRPVYDAMKWSSTNIGSNTRVIVSRKMGFIFSSLTACNVYCGVASDKETTKEEINMKLVLTSLADNKTEDAEDMLSKTGADYLFLDKSLSGDYYANTNLVLGTIYPKCFSNDEVCIYKLK